MITGVYRCNHVTDIHGECKGRPPLFLVVMTMFAPIMIMINVIA